MGIGISLHIGIEYFDAHIYKSDGALRTCGQDSLDMKAIAVAQGFQESILLLNEKATRDAVLEAITLVGQKLKAGDLFFISYSGHGTTLPDSSGNEKDGKDETWCLYDGFLLDDELYALWTLFEEGVGIFLLSDSCHSGTVCKDVVFDRESSIVSKVFPKEKAYQVYWENRIFYNEVKANVANLQNKTLNTTVTLFAGCQDDESSHILPHSKNSLFTAEINRVWNLGRFEGTIMEFFHEIEKGVCSKAKANKVVQKPNMLTLGKRNSTFEQQKPFEIFD